LTFLRFFALFVGASASGAEERLSLDGELLLGALVEGPSAPGAVSLGAVISSEGAPLDFRALPVIKRGKSGIGCFSWKAAVQYVLQHTCDTEKGNRFGSRGAPAW
jgi:hypothetical protein